MVFKMITHGVTEGFGRAMLNDIYQTTVRYEAFALDLLSEDATFVNVLKNRQQHLLKALKGLISSNLIQLAMKSHFLVNIKNHFFGIAWLVFDDTI